MARSWKKSNKPVPEPKMTQFKGLQNLKVLEICPFQLHFNVFTLKCGRHIVQPVEISLFQVDRHECLHGYIEWHVMMLKG